MTNFDHRRSLLFAKKGTRGGNTASSAAVISTIFTYSISTVLTAIVFVRPVFSVSADEQLKLHYHQSFPSGMEPNLFESQVFDPDAPFCQSREPCGFYSLTLDGTGHFRWIKSWCQCQTEHECVYDKTDKKVRVFRLSCTQKSAKSHRIESSNLFHHQHHHEPNFRHHHKHRFSRYSPSLLALTPATTVAAAAAAATAAAEGRL